LLKSIVALSGEHRAAELRLLFWLMFLLSFMTAA
jgi:hypothetical protein